MIRRSQHKEVYSTANVIYNITLKTKRTLRTDIPKHNVTTGLPKCPKAYGNGGLIVAETITYNQVRSYTTRVTSSECEVIQCNKLRTLNLETGLKKSTKVKIYDQITNKENLELAYELISNKKGSNTVGIDGKTLDSYSKDTINTVSKSLKDHSFRFKPIRRVFIPKPDGTQRPLGIPSPRDKVVLKTMAIALEKKYKHKFLDCNHGFRPNRGTHSAIKEATKWTGVR